MVSYQSATEFYSCFAEMHKYNGNCTDQNIYYNQSPTTYEIQPVGCIPENYINQEINPALAPECGFYELAQNEFIYENSHFYDNVPVPQYNQYTPLTPEPVPYPVFQLQPTQSHQHHMAQGHGAQIATLPSSRQNFKAVMKRKRKRTVFTTEQVEALEHIFKTKQYISREDRQDIVNKLQISDKSVKIWFQNRRLKIKRMTEEEPEDHSNTERFVEERSSPDLTRLDSVESQINKRADEFGFVTLDDGVIGDLVNVIDDYLTKSRLDIAAEKKSESDSTPVYEPISPASITDSSEEDNTSYWKPSEPNESLQRLFDLQTMISL